ncbi:hypothetical protein B4U79_07030 [Dinothrombium tinctorium]|uniref:ER-bound oxygenase mpaB/mpaB'/Rubber oxygenase catalytic domain-containing protein n=2 Tax=Dinothrombium tinctorium TaxID=1965070 RepID=A0A443QHU5_9ACAR|nr:hypothetical protein B4U79_07030 [Dinothrombium tinctorium]
MNPDKEKAFVEPIWVSQYEMVLTQWAIVAPFLLYPKRCGMHSVNKQELEKMIYFWQVIGHLLGIEDRFNCCFGGYEQSYAYCQLILERDYKPVLSQLKYPSNIGFEAAKGLAIGLQPLAPIVSLQGLLRYWYRFFGFEHYVPVSNRFGYKSIVYLIETMLQNPFWHWLTALILKCCLFIVTLRQKIIRKRLEKQYANVAYRPTCPFSYKSPKELLAY